MSKASPASRSAAEEASDEQIRQAARSGDHDALAPDEKAKAVQRMFSGVAPRYDLLNHLLSLNIDRSWRRQAVDRLLSRCPADGVILDSCAGTLDLAAELVARPGFGGRVIACDFTFPMLERGRAKVSSRPVDIVCADALRLPVADHTLDGAMVAFGVRNLARLDDGLREFGRVLKPGAPLVILEFTTPARQPLRGLYLLYFRRILPWVGRRVSGHGSAYSYLPDSVLAFPSPGRLSERIEQAGFHSIDWMPLTGGIAAIHVATRS
jgi:demethylmenaquinone methyltransferase / 2-methoxy-6-polyprenyl-1,4-benzoquinol methylase